MKKNLLFYLSIVLLLFITACENEDLGLKATRIKDFYSVGNMEGYIVHMDSFATPIVFGYYGGHTQGKALCVGWNSYGRPMRSFLSFDISEITPTGDKELVIEEALLSVYEANTNMNPFNADGIRTVDCFLVDYDTIAPSIYDITPIASCGTITSTGHNVLKEYPLYLTGVLNNYLQEEPDAKKFQFRLQFIPDEATTPFSKLSSAMWLFFAGKEDGSKKDYRPKLTLKYYYRKR